MDSSSTPCARLCHITKWEHFDGYGFNLHAEKGKTGQFIGKVDEGSPSEAAGLRQGDRIIEVNEINISNETHKQVVERIKAFPTETKLLVVDQIADDYYKNNNIPIKGTMPGIKFIKTPERNINLDYEEEDDNVVVIVDEIDLAVSSSNQPTTMTTTTTTMQTKTSNGSSQGTTSDTHSIASSSISDVHSIGNNNNNNNNSHTMSKENGSKNGTISNSSRKERYGTDDDDDDEEFLDNLSNKSSTSSGKVATSSQQQKSMSANGNGTTSLSTGTLNLQMSAKELRAKLASRKKYDPKKESLGFKDKFDIVQKL